LGYNPYEVNKATAGQARNAVTTVTHGYLQTPSESTTVSTTSSSVSTATLPTISSPIDPGTGAAAAADDDNNNEATNIIVPIEFNDIFESIVVSNTDHAAVRNSLTIACKIITNATTNDDSKFKKVRLANNKIQEAIVNVHGTLDLMLLVGFQLTTDPDTSESILIYPHTIQQSLPWIPYAINKLQSYCKEDEKSYTC
jgi:PUB domain